MTRDAYFKLQRATFSICDNSQSTTSRRMMRARRGNGETVNTNLFSTLFRDGLCKTP